VARSRRTFAAGVSCKIGGIAAIRVKHFPWKQIDAWARNVAGPCAVKLMQNEWSRLMINLLWKSAIGLGVAGTLALAVATPSLARVKNVDPGYGYGYGSQFYPGPYSGYAYVPAYGARRWDNSDDVGAPYTPCYPSLAWQNRC
jgi:hypothetical protein